MISDEHMDWSPLWRNVRIEILRRDDNPIRTGWMVVLMVYLPFCRLPLDLNAWLFPRESFSIWGEFSLS